LNYESLTRRILFKLPPETAHELGVAALRVGIGRQKAIDPEVPQALGQLKRFGLTFANPLGLAAGFDKNGVIVDQLADLGFGFVEVGTVTYESQPGNPKPRLFRLPADEALINRLGFNNDGAAKISERLSHIKRRCVVGVNIGRNKNVPNERAVENYLRTFERVHGAADYIAVNVSSPNTPDLRELQSSENLEVLVSSLQALNDELGSKPLLVKIAPDLDDAAIESIVDLCLRKKVSGIIATNTTISRDSLRTRNVQEFGAGGLSGKPIAKRSNEVISKIYRHSGGKVPIVGVGGIFTAQDAFDKIAAGATLVQAYTGFVYSGPSFATDIVSGLAQMIKARGFSNLDEVAGSGVT